MIHVSAKTQPPNSFSPTLLINIYSFLLFPCTETSWWLKEASLTLTHQRLNCLLKDPSHPAGSAWFRSHQGLSALTATGFDGEQALGVQLLQLGRSKRQLIRGEPLPLSHRSHLSWLGFTAEGQFLRIRIPYFKLCVPKAVVVPQVPPATWTQTGWSGCWTARWETRGHQFVTPGKPVKANRIITGWWACTRTPSSSGELSALCVVSQLKKVWARHESHLRTSVSEQIDALISGEIKN